MLSNTYRFSVMQGDTLDIDVTYKPGGAPMNLTGCTAVMGFKTATGITKLESPTGLTLGTDGTIKGRVDGSVTEDWPKGRLVSYQLRLTDTLGVRRTILFGEVEVSPGVVDG